MKKFLLVVLVGMAVVINIYGFVNELMVEEIERNDHISETTTTVYME